MTEWHPPRTKRRTADRARWCERPSRGEETPAERLARHKAKMAFKASRTYRARPTDGRIINHRCWPKGKTAKPGRMG